MTEIEKAKVTTQFLRHIAQHLSSRPDCKGVEYVVTIGTDQWKDAVLMSPTKYVFPNRYDRSPSYLESVVLHVLKHHMPELYLPRTECAYNAFVDETKIVPGTYMYQLSVDKKKRRWTKVESL